MNGVGTWMIVLALGAPVSASYAAEPQEDSPLAAVPLSQVHITDRFWLQRVETNRTVTIPYDLKQLEKTGCFTNFDKAAGTVKGEHQGNAASDSDVFKVLEGAALSLEAL